MKNVIILAILLFSCSTQREKQEKDDGISKTKTPIEQRLLGNWEYKFPNNTTYLNENHFMVFDSVDTRIKGIYYGTTDDFDEAREGYLPGFFAIPIDIKFLEDDYFEFALLPNDNEIYTTPVPIDHGSNDLDKWDYIIRFDPRTYKCKILGDSLLVKSKGIDDRIFKKIASTL